ncbi:MAG: hypothetical protein Ta2D_08050 [Rickettsiales bacterium]|nr:MAG: hypothetical protein Ta2D_08050 [Rickettsiales bacterium]
MANEEKIVENKTDNKVSEIARGFAVASSTANNEADEPALSNSAKIKGIAILKLIEQQLNNQQFLA